jgi:signal transduction histidine kinase
VSRTRLTLAAVAVAGLAFGVLSIAVARREPAYAFSGGAIRLDTANEIGGGLLLEPSRVAAELAAGWALLLVGLAAWARRPGAAFGALLAAASFGWFALEWNNPGIGSQAGFALGLLLYTAASPLVAHAGLAYPGRRLPRLDAVVVGVAYANALLVLGLASALVFDPDAALCSECPPNPLLIRDSPRLYDAFNSVGVRVGLAWSLAAVALLALRLARSTRAGRLALVPVLLPAAAYLALVAATFADAFESGALGTSGRQRDLWLGEAYVLVALATGVVWGWLHAVHKRAEVARLVVDGAGSREPGDLRARLGRMLGDPSVVVGYPLSSGRVVDAAGRPVDLDGEVTPLVRRGRTVAFLSHRPGLLADPALAADVAAAARLALEHERLQAELRAQLDELQESRARVVAAGDAERHRLERDLHDGAQQRLVGLSLQLGLLESTDGAHRSEIDEARGELDAALSSMREVGHGLFPALLAEEGLGAALEALTEEAPVEIDYEGGPDERLGAAVEAAAYFVVAETLRRSRRAPRWLVVAVLGDRVVVEAEAELASGALVHLEDRVGAAGGTLEATRESGSVTIRAEIPCGS